MAKTQKKGVQGARGSGKATRKAIKSAEKKGLTHKQIGRAAMRSSSVIGAIKSGEIKRPPSGLASKIKKGTKGKKGKR